MDRKTQKKTSPRLSNFLRKTAEILQNPVHQSSISWNESGELLCIHNIRSLETDVLPLYFRHTKLKSFIRQLNLYGFKKLRSSLYEMAYIHPEFQRKNLQHLAPIKRRKHVKKNRQAQVNQYLPSCESSSGIEAHFNDPAVSPLSNQKVLVETNLNTAISVQTEMKSTLKNKPGSESLKSQPLQKLPQLNSQAQKENNMTLSFNQSLLVQQNGPSSVFQHEYINQGIYSTDGIIQDMLQPLQQCRIAKFVFPENRFQQIDEYCFLGFNESLYF